MSNDDDIDVGSQHRDRGGCTAPFHRAGSTSNDCGGNGCYDGDFGGGVVLGDSVWAEAVLGAATA